jgi:hypothetical protein
MGFVPVGGTSLASVGIPPRRDEFGVGLPSGPADWTPSGRSFSMRHLWARFGVVCLVGLGLLTCAGAARAIQPTLVDIKDEGDGTYTYVFKITIDDGVRVAGGAEAPEPDFFTIYNFVGLVADSNKEPEGWKFSTADQGVTPLRGGKALINPTDLAGVPNVTWSYTGAEPLTGPKEITGFSVRTKVKDTVTGEYGVQVTRLKAGKLKGKQAKEARIGFITTPAAKTKE